MNAISFSLHFRFWSSARYVFRSEADDAAVLQPAAEDKHQQQCRHAGTGESASSFERYRSSGAHTLIQFAVFRVRDIEAAPAETIQYHEYDHSRGTGTAAEKERGMEAMISSEPFVRTVSFHASIIRPLTAENREDRQPEPSRFSFPLHRFPRTNV